MIISTILLFNTYFVLSQNNYYAYKGEKIYLPINYNYLYVSAPLILNYDSIFNAYGYTITSFRSGETNENISPIHEYWNILKILNTQLDSIQYYELLSILKNTSITYLCPVIGDQYPISCSNYFCVKLKNETDDEKLSQFAETENCQVVKQIDFMPNWWLLKSNKNSGGNSIELSNLFAESNLFADVDPGFMFNFKTNCVNDPLFFHQWGLDNASNPAIDINACQAWTVTTGSINVKVAVVDEGIDFTDIEFSNNLYPYSYDARHLTFPSALYGDHGTKVTGIIGANQNNNFQFSGVAPNSSLMSISHDLFPSNTPSFELASGISWAWQNGASIINNSWGDQGGSPIFSSLHSTTLENAILNAINNGRNGLGSVVVFAGGNSAPNLDYPAKFAPEIVCVGSIANTGLRSTFSAYGSELDIVAPGEDIWTTSILNGIGQNESGTSFAAPHVSGVAALILSVNPCLTGQQVRDIIESTAQKVGGYSYSTTAGRPNGTWNNEMGYGLVDAYAAVQAAQVISNTAPADLFTRDSYYDFGIEPNPGTGPLWVSDDIWVRNYDDGIQIHQNPEYSVTADNYVYVRVVNRGCTDFVATNQDFLHLYWSKASSALDWDTYWNGSITASCSSCSTGVATTPIMGNEVLSSPQPIPNIPAGGEVIIKFPWHVPNPDDYCGCNPEPWHFCLLSRIVSPSDPMSFPETTSVYDNAKNNNNIAWKNLTVVDLLPGIATGNECYSDQVVGGTIAVGNPFKNGTDNYQLEFKLDEKNRGIPIFKQAEIKLTLDDLSWEKWVQGGYQGNNVKIKREDCHQLIITGNPATLKNLTYNENQRSTLHVSFNFLTDKVDATSEFDYHVIQMRSADSKIIGGELYRIRKPVRYLFGADAGSNQTLSLGDSVTLSANSIGEPAYYNWYDPEGNLIYSGTNLKVTPEITTKYKLEVIALSDGFASYDSVTVTVKEFEIKSISPNPTSSQVTINYRTNNATSAYLVITHPSGMVENNYILNASQSTTTLNVSNYSPGNYNLILVCDGEVKDQKILSIQ